MKKLTSLLLVCIFALTAHAQVYVKPAAEGGSDANDGVSWTTAKATVAGAIAVVQKSEKKEIWVKKGTYSEIWGIALNAANVGGVSIYGGFSGNELSAADRIKGTNPWDYTNETVITFTNETGMSIQMNNNLTAANPFVIDGFSFKNMDNKTAGSMQLRTYATMQNCIISNNKLTTGFLNSYGGAEGPTTFRNCFISNNTITGNNVLTHNTNHIGQVGVVDGCVFVNNISTSHQIVNGGGKGIVSVRNSSFYNNSAAGYILNMGAAIGTEVVNCLVYNNEAAAMVAMSGAGEAAVINSTIVNNKGKAANGGVSLANTKAKIYNTIVRGNQTADGVAVGISGTVAGEVKNSAIDVVLPENVESTNNQLYYPEMSGFAAPSTFVGMNADKTSELAAANWQLTNQPHGMINAGDKALLAETYSLDLAGKARVQNDKIDLGAYESSYIAPALPTLTVAVVVGGTTSVDKNGSYYMGEGIAITSTPANSYKLKEWSDGTKVVSTEKDFTYVMTDKSVTLTAKFESATQRSLTIIAGENGTASVNKTGQYFADETIELTATPNAEYVFANWTDDDNKVVSTKAAFSYTMPDKNVTLKANFKYHLTRYLISEKGSDMKWTRALGKGETIIDLTSINKPFDEFIKDGLWPTPLSEGDEVWLMGDWYTIYQPLVFTTAGVKWYGGFAGTETSADQREKSDLDENGLIEPWEFTNQSVFDGQMQELSIAGTVLKINQGITVDGIVAQGGQQGAVDTGAGVCVGENNADALPAVLRNSIVRKNLVTGATASAYSCGAVAEWNSTIEYCLIEDNLIDATNTGATYAAGVASPRATSMVANCVIRNNRNLGTSGGNCQGGGAKSSSILKNCLIYNNVATRGAGIYVNDAATVDVQFCTVVNNKSESFMPDGTQTAASGAGVYFRGLNSGGAMKNSVIWNNSCVNEARNNVYIETDAAKKGLVQLGAIAYNAGSDDLKAGTYTPVDGNENSIATLADADVFTKPISLVGYIEDAVWECDWRPKTTVLQVGVQLAEEEYDILNFKRSTSPTLGAYEFGSTPGTGIFAPTTNKLDAFVYCSGGKLYVNNMTPVAVEVYDISGAKVLTAKAAADHSFTLPQGMYVVIVKDANSQATSKVLLR